ncbi:MAG: SGNH/GDSL hydrolase family protein, partial [Vicinamibacterales bacterium]
SYPAFMTRALAARRPGVEWTTVNLSVFGVGSSRMSLILGKALAFQPDLVILAPHGSNEYEDERDLAYVRAVNSGYKGLLFKSRAVVLLKQVFDQHLSFRPDSPPTLEFEEEETASLKPENVARWHAALRENMRNMVQRARDRTVPVLLVGRAERDRGPGGRDSTQTAAVNDLLRQLANRPDVVFFDLSAALDTAFRTPGDRAAVFQDESHLQAQGHAAAGEALATLVLTQFRLPEIGARLK